MLTGCFIAGVVTQVFHEYLIRAEEECVEKVGQLLQELIVFSLKSELEDIQRTCGHVRQSLGPEALQFLRLLINRLDLFNITAQLTPPGTLCV